MVDDYIKSIKGMLVLYKNGLFCTGLVQRVFGTICIQWLFDEKQTLLTSGPW